MNYHDKVVWGDHTTSLFAPSEPFLVATDGVRILSIPGASQSFLLGLLEFARPTPQGYTRHFSLLAEKTISLPLSTKEQEKIGTFFRALDELIAAREEELEKLRQMKAALLDAMFPNDAPVERVTSATAHTLYDSLLDHTLQAWDIVPTEPSTPHTPRLRFRGFTDPWQRMRLGDITTYSKGNGYSKSDLKDEGIPVILYGSLYTDYRSEINDVNTFTDSSDGATLSGGGEVIVPASGETAEDIARASVIKVSNVIIGGDLNIIYPDSVIDSLFLALEITYGQCHDALVKKAQGTSVIHLHCNDIEELDCSFPSLAEQKQIGAFFRSQDEGIATATEQIDKLKRIKQACLKQMFV